MIPLNDLRRHKFFSTDIEQAIIEVYRSGFWIHGSEHQAFENELATFLELDFVLGVASGTDALEIAMRALGCVNGSKVITVANAGGYTSIAGSSIGCEIIYCDVDTQKLLMDPESLIPLLSSEIKVVVVTHLYGNVAPVAAIRELCEPYGIKIIEDCAQSIGASALEGRVGTIGHVGTFSFYPTKNLGAIGDGGALATNDPEIAQKIIELRQYGWRAKYEIDVPGGMNSRLDEIQAAVLRIGLSKLDCMNQKRREIIEQYSKALQGSNLRLVTSFQPNDVAHLAVLQVSEDVGRDNFRNYMSELGIQTGVHYPILDCDQEGLKPSFIHPDVPTSRRTSSLIVSIPLFPELEVWEVNKICDALSKFTN